MSTKKLRIVTLNYLPFCYDLTERAIYEMGHNIVLAVTSPGPKSKRTPSYIDVVKTAQEKVDVLVTRQIKEIALPAIQALEPDLLISFSFPYRLTPELYDMPTYGTINVHPTALPAYRGPNVMRQFYDGAPVFGSTVHIMAEGYDTGNILSQATAPMPELITPETIYPQWLNLTCEVLREGIEKVAARESGTPQNCLQASYAAKFTEEELWLDWNEPCSTILRKFTALNGHFDWNYKSARAKAKIGDSSFKIKELKLLSENKDFHASEKLIDSSGDYRIVEASDGAFLVLMEAIERSTYHVAAAIS